MPKQYCVVLGDVVDSREIDDREAFQRTLTETLATVNEEYDDSLQAPFAVLKGVDEIGGVLREVPPVVEIQRRLARAVHPQQIRVVAVLGQIDVNEASADVSAMDGEAFARADALLSELESDDLTFRLEGDESVLDDLISDEVNLLDMLRAEWTERQLEVVTRFDELDSQKAVAESLGVSPQAVSKALSRTRGRNVLAIEERLAEAVQLYPRLRTD